MSTVDPSTLFGFNPDSPYAKLFVDIYQLTKPDKKLVNTVNVDVNMNVVLFCENISDDEKEEGEIDDDKIEEAAVTPMLKPKLEAIPLFPKKLIQHRPTLFDLATGVGQITGPTVQSDGEGKYSPSPNLMDIQSQIELDNNPVRLWWLHHLLDFMKSRGTPLKFSPTKPTAVSISPEMQTVKQPLDLYSLYQNTKAQAGGMKGCTEAKSWKAVAVSMKVPAQKAFVLRSVYQKFLFPLEESQNNNERKVLLPTPGVQVQGQGSSFQGHEDRKGLGGKIWKMKGNIKKRLGLKKKGGNFKKGFPPGFGEFHG